MAINSIIVLLINCFTPKVIQIIQLISNIHFMTLQGTVRKFDFKILKMSQKLNEKSRVFAEPTTHTYSLT